MPSMNNLSKKSEGTCFHTLLHGKNVALTKVNTKKRLVEINPVLVSQPDLFLEGGLAIHGVLGTFSVLDPRNEKQGWCYIQSPECDSNSSLISDVRLAKNVIEWARIIRLLSSNGFISFAIGLHSVLESILRDNMNWSSVTIFTPPEFQFVASPSGLLQMIVRLHILPQRFTYRELSDRDSVMTLIHGETLEITGVGNSTRALAVNGVEIVDLKLITSMCIDSGKHTYCSHFLAHESSFLVLTEV